MSTIPQQIQSLKNSITSLSAKTEGIRNTGILFAILGNYVVFGSKIEAQSGMTLKINGQAAGDSVHLNPDIVVPSLRAWEYPNIAMIFGEAFLIANGATVTLDDAPGTAGTARYDAIYAYIGQAGPAIGKATGTASTTVFNDFGTNGLNQTGAFDPAIPQGALKLARAYVSAGVVSIPQARIADARNFASRLG